MLKRSSPSDANGDISQPSCGRHKCHFQESDRQRSAKLSTRIGVFRRLTVTCQLSSFYFLQLISSRRGAARRMIEFAPRHSATMTRFVIPRFPLKSVKPPAILGSKGYRVAPYSWAMQASHRWLDWTFVVARRPGVTSENRDIRIVRVSFEDDRSTSLMQRTAKAHFQTYAVSTK